MILTIINKIMIMTIINKIMMMTNMKHQYDNDDDDHQQGACH